MCVCATTRSYTAPKGSRANKAANHGEGAKVVARILEKARRGGPRHVRSFFRSE